MRFTFLGCLFPFAILPALVSAGTIEFDPPSYHQEIRSREATLIPIRFAMRNRSSAPCVVQEVKASCSCTKIDLKNRILFPGEKIDIETSLTLKSPNKGLHTVIYFIMQDDQVLEYEITLEFKRSSVLRFRPNVLLFEDGIAGETREREFEVSFSDGGEKDVAAPPLHLNVTHSVGNLRILPVKERPGHFWYRAEYDVLPRPVRLEGEVVFVDPISGLEGRLPLRIRSEGLVRAEPPAIAWGFLYRDAGGNRGRDVSLRLARGSWSDVKVDLVYDKSVYGVVDKGFSSDGAKVYHVALNKAPRKPGRFVSDLSFRITRKDISLNVPVKSSGYVVDSSNAAEIRKNRAPSPGKNQ